MSLCVCFQRQNKDFAEELTSPLSGGNGSSHSKAGANNASNGSNGHEKNAVVPEVVQEPPEKIEVFKGVNDGVIWNCPIGKHRFGEFSFAVVQGNTIMEDHSHVECSSSETFVGVYDGHGGSQCSKFLVENMPRIIKSASESNGGVGEQTLTAAFQEADNELLEMVRENWKIQPSYAAAGSCALVGMVERGTLYVASVGDSRAVLGTSGHSMPLNLDLGGMVGLPSHHPKLRAFELTVEHNASREEVRKEVLERCPDDPRILLEKGGMWRVKGIIQVTRSLGDFYLKHEEFQCHPLPTKFRLPDGLPHPALINTPSVAVRPLTPGDKFVIFATDGLWDNVSSQEAVDIVNHHSRAGIARRLAKLSLVRAAKRRKLTYKLLSQMRPGRRREIHDDISVVVLFLDSLEAPARSLEPLSLNAFQELPERPADAPGPEEEEVPDDYEHHGGSGILGSGIMKAVHALQ